MKNKILLVVTIFVLASSFSCKKDKPEPVSNPPTQNEEELITTMQLTFVDSSGVEPDKVFSFQDIDGPGGNSPTLFDTIQLNSNKTYFVSLVLLNESVSPVENISDEVLTEGDEHLFCFEPSIGGNLIITRTDSDGTYEIGLSSKWKTISVSNGTVLIKLKHQPGIKNGLCDVGETDIELDFKVEIQ
jgi:hypothetical protein